MNYKQYKLIMEKAFTLVKRLREEGETDRTMLSVFVNEYLEENGINVNVLSKKQCYDSLHTIVDGGLLAYRLSK